MSIRLKELVDSVNALIGPLANTPLTFERQRKQARAYLMALEKISRDLRKELLKESKDIVKARKEQREAKKNSV